MYSYNLDDMECPYCQYKIPREMELPILEEDGDESIIKCMSCKMFYVIELSIETTIETTYISKETEQPEPEEEIIDCPGQMFFEFD